jgi:uncharacterized membrane protein
MISETSWLTFVGIILQILGFVLMLKYLNKEPTAYDAKKWIDRHIAGHPEWCKDLVEIIIRKGYPNITIDVPRKFYRSWKIVHQIPIFLNISGLILTAIQLLG